MSTYVQDLLDQANDLREDPTPSKEKLANFANVLDGITDVLEDKTRRLLMQTLCRAENRWFNAASDTFGSISNKHEIVFNKMARVKKTAMSRKERDAKLRNYRLHLERISRVAIRHNCGDWNTGVDTVPYSANTDQSERISSFLCMLECQTNANIVFESTPSTLELVNLAN